MTTTQRKKTLLLCVLPVIVVVGVPLIYWAWFILNLNFWIHGTTPELEDYPYRLIHERKVYTNPGAMDPHSHKIDNVLINEMSKDRIVINLSRTEIRFSPRKKRAYTKVYLETAVPEKDNGKRVRVKLLECLKRQGDTWVLVSTSNLLIQ